MGAVERVELKRWSELKIDIMHKEFTNKLKQSLSLSGTVDNIIYYNIISLSAIDC